MSETLGPVAATGIWQLLSARADQTPDRIVVVDQRFESLTFAELVAKAESVAAGLADLGVRARDVVSWQLPSRLDTIVLTLALSRLGAVQNPLIAMLREAEVEFICGQTGARLLVVPSVFRGFDHAAMARSIAGRLPGLRVLDADAGLPVGDPSRLGPPPDPDPDQAATETRWLFYTSGTTAAPKGARHTDAGLLAAAEYFRRKVPLEADDRTAALAPMPHVGGILHILSAVSSGSRIVTTDVFDPASTPEQMERAEVTLGGSGVPFIQVYLKRQRQRPDRPFFGVARAFLVGGAPRPPTLHYEVKDELGGVGVLSGYGLTECPYIAWGGIGDPDDKLAATEGRPDPATEIKILDAADKPVPVGESGALLVRAPQLMLGYVDESLDADAFDEDGFFRTGDLAKIDDDGYLTITGRIKDVIIRNMENISAREVENMALTFKAAADVAVIGLPDPETGERVCAVVVPADPAAPPTLADLVAHLRAVGLNPRKLPVQLELVAELPRNAMAKVIKSRLKEQVLSRVPSPTEP